MVENALYAVLREGGTWPSGSLMLRRNTGAEARPERIWPQPEE